MKMDIYIYIYTSKPEDRQSMRMDEKHEDRQKYKDG